MSATTSRAVPTNAAGLSQPGVVAQVKLQYAMPGRCCYRDEQQRHLWTFGSHGKVVALHHFLDTATLLAATRGEDTTLS